MTPSTERKLISDVKILMAARITIESDVQILVGQILKFSHNIDDLSARVAELEKPKKPKQKAPPKETSSKPKGPGKKK